VWRYMWLRRLVCLLKPRLQMWHLKGHDPLWTYMWLLRSPGVGNDFEHSVHLWGFSCKGKFKKSVNLIGLQDLKAALKQNNMSLLLNINLINSHTHTHTHHHHHHHHHHQLFLFNYRNIKLIWIFFIFFIIILILCR